MVKKLNSNAYLALKEEILALEVVKEYQRYYQIIKQNSNLHSKIKELHHLQKEIVNAKEFGLTNALLQYQNAYDKLLKEFDDNPLLANYLALKNEVNNLLILITEIIQNDLNKELEK